MASFEQRESGYWQAKVRRKGQPTQSKSFRTKTAAESWARQVEAQIERGAFISTSRAEATLFKDLAKTFTEDFAPHHYRGKAWKTKLAHLVTRFGAFSLVALTSERVAWYRDQRLGDPDPRYKNPKTAPRISGATVKTELDLLSKVLDVASKEFSIPLPLGNPVAQIRKPKDGPSRDRRLTVQDAEALLAACGQSQNRWLLPAVEFSIASAMRQGEQLSLTWDRIDPATETTGTGFAWLPQTKNGTARAVPLSSTAFAVLERLPRSIDGRVFPIAKQTLYTAFRTACTHANIENFRWHDLRREAASHLAARKDISQMELAYILGHHNLQSLPVYVKLRASELAAKLG